MSIEFYTQTRKESVQRELREQKETEKSRKSQRNIFYTTLKGFKERNGKFCLCDDRAPAEI